MEARNGVRGKEAVPDRDGRDDSAAEDRWWVEGGSMTANRKVTATDGWTPLEFYAFIVRTLGIPASFRFDGNDWIADAPFAKPSKEILSMLEANGPLWDRLCHDCRNSGRAECGCLPSESCDTCVGGSW